MCKYYAGIGSRKTPPKIIEKFKDLAEQLAKLGYCLRSGGAEGADTAFELGCDRVEGKKQIFLPWKGFVNNQSPFFEPPPEAFKIAEKFHPGWKGLGQGAKRLHARNSQQVLGPELNDPVDFVVCYTSEHKGGTLQALRVAYCHRIPVFNFIKGDYSFRGILRRVYEDKCCKRRTEELYHGLQTMRTRKEER